MFNWLKPKTEMYADPNITLQTYAHVLDEMKDSESDKIKQIF